MLTIKHIDDQRREQIKTAVHVSYDPEANVLTGHGCPTDAGGTEDVKYDTGYVFVTEGGKTVGAYNLRKQ